MPASGRHVSTIWIESLVYREERTLRTVAGCEGIGLHSGSPVRMTLRPLPPDSGIVFRRSDAGAAENLATTDLELPSDMVTMFLRLPLSARRAIGMPIVT